MMNVTDRFDGAAEWQKLTPEQQARFGPAALEIVLSWIIVEAATGHHEPTRRVGEAAGIAACGVLSTTFDELFSHTAISTAERTPKLPSIVGPICRECGCTENDACAEGCGWATPEQDLCTACARA